MKKRILKTLMVVLLPVSVWAQTSLTSSNYFGDNAVWSYDEETKTLIIRPDNGEGNTQQSWDMFSNTNIKVLVSDDMVTTDNVLSFDIYSGTYTSVGQNGTNELCQDYRFADFVPINRSVNITVNFNIPHTLADTYDIYLVTCPIWLKNDYENIPQEEWDIRPYKFSVSVIEDGSGKPQSLGEFNSQGMIYDKDGHIIVNDTTYLGQYHFNNAYENNVVIQINSIVSSTLTKKYSREMLINSIMLKPQSNTSFGVLEDAEHVVIEDGIEEMNYAFGTHGFQNLKTVEIPNSVTSINDNTFRNCTDLTSVNIGNGVEFIGNNAFYNCVRLTSVIIPNSVTLISNQAFYDCRSLTNVYCYAENVPSTAQNIFDSPLLNIKRKATLHVPQASLEAYKTTEPWSGFGTIVPLTDEETSIESVTTEKKAESFFTLDGKAVDSPQKGVNIIRMENGKTKKVYVR